MWSISIVTPPSPTPVATADIKAHLRLNTSAEDTLLADWVLVAAEEFARETGYSLTNTALRLSLDSWPCESVLYIPRHPVTAVTSVQYLDTSGTWQTVDGSTYTTDLSSLPARILFKTNFVRASLHETAKPCVRVNFSAGHSSTSDIPRMALQAVKLRAAEYYRDRENTSELNTKPISAGFQRICDHYKTGILCDFNEGA